MDRQLSKSEQRQSPLRRFGLPIAAVALLALAYLGLRKTLTRTAHAGDLHIATVERGTIINSLSASGLVIPAAERVINAPVTTEIAEVLLTTGSAVKAGDVILQLDQDLTRLDYQRLQDELALRQNNIAKLKLQYDKELRDLDYQDQIKALKLDEFQAKVKDAERLHQIGGATLEEVEATQLQLHIAQLEKKMLANELDYRRNVNQTDKDNLQLEYNIQAKRLSELRKKLNETTVSSPQSGVITWINEDIGKTVQEGEPLVRIANLDRFKVEASTSDRNTDDLKVGMPVQVDIGDQKVTGTVDRISPEIINNTVRFYITLDEDNHPDLRPNLRTQVSIIKEKKENVLKCRRGIAFNKGKQQYIYKVSNGQASKTRITKGASSSKYVEILEGLEAGDRVIISETTDYDHMDQFKIEN